MSKDTSNERHLFEDAPVLRAILTLGLPSILGQLILVIYNMADTLFVGLTENDVMINGVTICMPVYMILTAISNLFGVGGLSVIARSMGKDNETRARRSAEFAFWGCLLTSLIYCAIIAILSSSITDYLLPRSLGAHGNDEVAKQASQYILIAVCLCGIPTTLSTLFSHLIRAQGFAMHTSIGIAIGGILNIGLDPLFIFAICGKDNAALGAGIATGISNIVALLYFIIIFIKLKKKLVISVKFSKNMFKDGIPRETLTIGLPACLMTLCENISYWILGNQMGLVATTVEGGEKVFGIALSGVEVSKKVNMFAHNAVRGMAQGVMPLIGYNKASGNRKRMKKIVYLSGAISLGIALTAAIINILPSGKGLISLFLHGGQAEDYMLERQKFGYAFLQIFSLGAPFSAIAYTIISFFQAVGKPWRSLILALLRKGILDIPLMFLLNFLIVEVNGYGGVGLVLATPISDAICCFAAIAIFSLYIKKNGHNKGSYAEIKQ